MKVAHKEPGLLEELKAFVENPEASARFGAQKHDNHSRSDKLRMDVIVNDSD